MMLAVIRRVGPMRVTFSCELDDHPAGCVCHLDHLTDDELRELVGSPPVDRTMNPLRLIAQSNARAKSTGLAAKLIRSVRDDSRRRMAEVRWANAGFSLDEAKALGGSGGWAYNRRYLAGCDAVVGAVDSLLIDGVKPETITYVMTSSDRVEDQTIDVTYWCDLVKVVDRNRAPPLREALLSCEPLIDDQLAAIIDRVPTPDRNLVGWRFWLALSRDLADNTAVLQWIETADRLSHSQIQKHLRLGSTPAQAYAAEPPRPAR